MAPRLEQLVAMEEMLGDPPESEAAPPTGARFAPEGDCEFCDRRRKEDAIADAALIKRRASDSARQKRAREKRHREEKSG